MMYLKKKRKRLKAFTLAEVLVTLAVIGVVAALTIPPLTKLYQDIVRAASYKKAHAQIEQLYRMSIADNNGYNYNCTYITGKPSSQSLREGCPDLWQAFIRNGKAITVCNKDEGGTIGKCIPEPGVLMPDGSEILAPGERMATAYQDISHAMVLKNGHYIFMWWIASAGGTWPLYAYDINGFKGPNQWGEDVFSFIISDYKVKIYTAGNQISGAKDILKNNN